MLSLLQRLKRGASPTEDRVGVAIGPQGMLAVHIKDPFGPRPRIQSSLYRPDASETAWPQAFAEIERALSAEGLPVVVALDPSLASLLQLSLPKVPEAEMANALKFRAREISPIPLDEMVLDYVEVPGMRARGGEKIGYGALARRTQMLALRDAVKDAGMRLEAIDVKDMVLRHLLARVQSADENGALLMIGEQGSHIIVARNDQLYLFRTSNIRASQLAQPGNDRLDALVLEIQRTLDFYDSNFTDPPPRRLWLLTGKLPIPHLAERLGDMMRLPVAELKLDEVVEGIQQLDGQPTELVCLALGAALRPRGEGGKA
jgi:MSHA biogenesis protein MshI